MIADGQKQKDTLSMSVSMFFENRKDGVLEPLSVI